MVVLQLLLGLGSVILLAAPALPAPVRVQCQGTQCQEFDVVERQVVRERKDGTLIWTRTLAWTQDGFQRLSPSEETGHVFCSTTRPALITTENGATATVMLAPLSEWEYERAPDLYLKYFETCHSAGAAVATGRDKVARELGYRVLRVNMSRPLGLTKPESIFYFPAPNGEIAP